MGIAGGEPFWLAVRGNIVVLGDVEQWWRVVDADEIEPVIDDQGFCTKAQALLPSGPFDEQSMVTSGPAR